MSVVVAWLMASPSRRVLAVVGLVAVLAVLAGLAAALWDSRTVPGIAPDPYTDPPAVIVEQARQEAARVDLVDRELAERRHELNAVLETSDEQRRTEELARLIDRWAP